jgi:putative flippase GtrA
VTPAHRRLLPFVAFGAVGFVVQLTSLHLLVAYAGVHYLLATALAVEAAILVNFVCHSRWTWRDRRLQFEVGKGARLRQLARFNGLSALSSLTGNVAFTAVLVGTLAVPVVAANAIAVALISAINFTGLDRWVFTPGPAHPSTRVLAAAVLALLSLSLPVDASAADLTPETRRGWQRYVATTEARIDRELHTPGRFLSMDFDTPADRQRALEALRGGSVMVVNLDGDRGEDVPGGAIHHWRGAVIIPGTTVDDVLRTVSDPTGTRAQRQEDVLEARVLSRSPGSLRLFLKLQRNVIVSAAYNTEHDVVYHTHGSGRASSRSIATRIAEVVNLGEPGEYERRPGADRGFLWGLNSYWRYQAVPGGVLVELESLTLSRSVPWGVGAVVHPLVHQVARESITRTLQALRQRFAENAVS